MKRKINKRLFCIALILVLLACGICIIGATSGSIYVRTNGSPSENVRQLFSSVISGDGDACIQFTDSYQQIDFDASGETEAVAVICKALQDSYSWEYLSEGSDGEHSLSSEDAVLFTYLNIDQLADDIASEFDEDMLAVVMDYGANVTTSDGKYLPEIYEEAYLTAVTELLQDPKAYYTADQLQIGSYYDETAGKWRTEIDQQLAGMLQGGITGGLMSDTLSIPRNVRSFVDNSIDIMKGDTEKGQNNYTLPYSSTVGPKPDESNYFRFSVDEADQVMNIIAYARSVGLLEGQDVIFDPDAVFYPDQIICYCDETILIICWKEYINGSVCNCMEIKIADGSQIKRKLAGDSYNSGILDYMSNLSAASNAVAAMNGDYYGYRPYGITVYQGQLYRFETSCEVLMIDEDGRFIFYYPDGRSADELQEFIDQNHVQFSLAFGPVLVENYTPRYYVPGYVYGLGQMEDRYTRAAFGEYDDLHYLFMTSGYAVNAVPPADLNAFIDIVLTKDLKNVYNLDGGQTAEIVIQNTPYNQIDYRAERQMSDMVFFATALFTENENE